jgi:putative ABC transport system permease protein
VAVILQLSVSVVFIVAASVVMMQMRFVNRKDLGFDHSGIIQLKGSPMTMEFHGRALMSQLAAIPQIENFSVALFEPQHNAPHFTMITEVEWQGKPAHEKPVFQTIEADSRLAETFRLKMLMGDWWSEGERQKIVLNEEAVRVMGLTNPVGATVRVSPGGVSSTGVSPMREYEVAGVVNNFHTLSLRNRIQPVIFRSPSATFVQYIRTVPGQEQEAMRRITAILPDIDASLADIQLTPLNELYDRLNRSEQVGLKMFSVMAAVCLLISLFGIYAVSTASTQRRRKEIAIRKVMGAEAINIILMFFREYALQVIIASVVALPLAYLAMSHWLQEYAYRINISLWLLAGVITVIIAVVLLTVLRQVLKAASRNPAEVVKSE